MSTIKCLIVDDEPLGREILENFVKRIHFLELAGICEDAFEALEILENHPVDLLLSDIQMPQINGLEFARSLPSPPVIIFITAYDQFAVNSFELGVADYLLKPVSFDRFLKAINKAKLQIEMQKNDTAVANSERQDYFFIKADNKLNKVIFSKISYIEAIGDYIKIFSSEPALLTYSSLKAMEEKLPFDRFVRIHNSYIVSVSAVKAVNANTVELFDGTSLPVAKARREALFAALQINDDK